VKTWNDLKNYAIENQFEIEQYAPWEELDGWDWACLLEHMPEFSKFCAWKKLDSNDWIHLLQYQPQFKVFKVTH
jgi:hypothetical protein